MKITVDYKLLKEQRVTLSKLILAGIEGEVTQESTDHLEGILSLLEAIGDKRPFPVARREKKC